MHKRTITPTALSDRDGIAVIGRTLHDLRGIRFENEPGGGAPPAEPPAPASPPAAAPQFTPPPAAPAPAAQPPAPQPPIPAAAPAPIQYQGNPDDYVRELRGEAKQHREAFEREQTAHQTAAQERDAAAAERDRLARENHLLRAAPKYGANADLLLDSSSFMKSFADVDLASEEAVKKAIEDAIERNAAFQSGPGLPPTSGGGHQGGAAPANPVSLDGAVKKALGG
ncbi:hypothetical protein [Agromyces sp. NBRC 114283]|uniref:hypothetical protein n=1 Tax=Agromyces sp. NBRC 114283 TaxID=2994521 RepID=UPI0024A016FC|nr:hypothetical protein [Agromyces sp. NBRC 114283]GLU91342.1 hypothetical protein Agsp01_35970 [Agromyces sp. NBRC 114283]